MTHMSKAIGAAKAKVYFERDFAAQASVSYYTQGHTVGGQWHGKFAEELGLKGKVEEAQYLRMVDGRDPNARYDPEQLKGWVQEKGSYYLRDKEGNEVAAVWKEGAVWHRSGSETTYTTALSAQNAAKNEAVGQWIEHRNTISQKTGRELEHRAGVDIVYNWSKEISIIAAHDPEVYRLEQIAVRKGLEAMEEFVQVRMGGDNMAQATGKWAIASFQHTTARPVDGYSAPHLHTHAFWMNMSRDADGKIRAVDPNIMYSAQRYGSAVAQAEFAYLLTQRGYEVERGKNNAPIIKGFTEEYLKAESPRSEQIKEIADELGVTGNRRAEEEIAHKYRDAKLSKPAEEIKADHERKAAEFGNQHEAIIEAATERRKNGLQFERRFGAEEALTYAKNRLMERQDVFTSRELTAEALWAGQNHVRLDDIKTELANRSQTEEMYENSVPAEFLLAKHVMKDNEPGMRYTTHEAHLDQRAVLEVSRQGRGAVDRLLPAETTIEQIHEKFAYLNGGAGLNDEQARAVLQQSTWTDRVQGIRGGAGVGKTKAVILPINKIAEEKGYEVIGMAPTGRARHELADAEIKTTLTLQKFLAQGPIALRRKGFDDERLAKPRLYIVDESSLAGTKQYLKLLQMIHMNKEARPHDRIIEVGDPRQHQSIQAGRIFEQQIKAGMSVSDIDKVVRQKPPELKAVAEKLQFSGKEHIAIRMLQEQGRVHEIRSGPERLKAIAEKYASNPENALVVSPDNESRRDLNILIRQELRSTGKLGLDKIKQAQVYVQRQELVSEDLKIAARYRVGDVLRFEKGSKKLGIEREGYGEVIRRNTDIRNQWIEVQLYRPSAGINPETGKPDNIIRYDPRDFSSASVYERQARDIADGDKLVLKKAWKGLENGDTITVKEARPDGYIEARADKNDKRLIFNVAEMPHVDHGYAMTSFLSQGVTVDTVLVNGPAEDRASMATLTDSFAKVALTRGRFDAHFYTDNVERAKTLLRRDSAKDLALPTDETISYVGPTQQKQSDIEKLIRRNAEQERSRSTGYEQDKTGYGY